MTADEARELIENSPMDCSSVDSIYAGLTILKKHHGDSKWRYSLGHDQMWVGAVDFDQYVAVMSATDIERMGSLGWTEDEDAWRHSAYAG